MNLVEVKGERLVDIKQKRKWSRKILKRGCKEKKNIRKKEKEHI